MKMLLFQIVFLIFWYLIIFNAFGLIKIKKNKAMLLIFLEVFLLVPLYLGFKFYSRELALIKTDNAILYAGPSQDYHQIKDIPKLSEVEINQKFGDWFKIYYDNTTGWLKSDDLTLL